MLGKADIFEALLHVEPKVFVCRYQRRIGPVETFCRFLRLGCDSQEDPPDLHRRRPKRSGWPKSSADAHEATDVPQDDGFRPQITSLHQYFVDRIVESSRPVYEFLIEAAYPNGLKNGYSGGCRSACLPDGARYFPGPS